MWALYSRQVRVSEPVPRARSRPRATKRSKQAAFSVNPSRAGWAEIPSLDGQRLILGSAALKKKMKANGNELNFEEHK